MFSRTLIRPSLTTNLDTTTFCCRKKVVHISESSGVVGTLHITPYRLAGLMASNFLRSLGIPCLLYIDDRHNGQLQVPLNKGEYGTLHSVDKRNLAAAKSAVFLVAFYLVRLGYFLGLTKSILTPQKMVPYLGFLADSSREVFHLIPDKKRKFLELIRETTRAMCRSRLFNAWSASASLFPWLFQRLVCLLERCRQQSHGVCAQ